MIEGRVSPRWVTLASRVARTEASASTSTLAPANFAGSTARATSWPRIASSRSWSPWWRWSALVAANRMRSIRRVTRPLSQLVRPRRKEERIAASAVSRSATAALPGIERGERVDQHDLAVEAGEVIAEERPHDHRLIGLVAARHHAGERAHGLVRRSKAERREGQRRRAGEVARHQEAAGRLRRQRRAVGAAGEQVLGVEPRQLARGGLVVLARLGRAASRASNAAAVRAAARRFGRRRWRPPTTRDSPCRAAAGRAAIRPGIVDDVEVELAAADEPREERRRLVADGQAQLADLAGRVRPDALVDQRADVAPHSRSAAPHRRAAARAAPPTRARWRTP